MVHAQPILYELDLCYGILPCFFTVLMIFAETSDGLDGLDRGPDPLKFGPQSGVTIWDRATKDRTEKNDK